MTALITKIRSWDGKKEVPVCGVLIGYDDFPLSEAEDLASETALVLQEMRAKENR